MLICHIAKGKNHFAVFVRKTPTVYYIFECFQDVSLWQHVLCVVHIHLVNT